MKNVLFPKIQAIGDTQFQGIPMRRATAADTDGPFGNPTLGELQDWSDQNYAAQQKPSLSTVAAQATPAQVMPNNGMPFTNGNPMLRITRNDVGGKGLDQSKFPPEVLNVLRNAGVIS